MRLLALSSVEELSVRKFCPSDILLGAKSLPVEHPKRVDELRVGGCEA